MPFVLALNHQHFFYIDENRQDVNLTDNSFMWSQPFHDIVSHKGGFIQPPKHTLAFQNKE